MKKITKKAMIRGLKFMFKKSGKIDIGKIDFESEVDSELTFSENYRILKEKYIKGIWDRW